ncbi:MAG: helix-turn-helix transcriptional regulator [Clostridiaceae bacterium]|nr:helix-turn-helix transcriptional regulator [Clostridiaceae bacterium]
MSKSSDNLKAVLDYYGIAQNNLAQALGVDPSLVSRWLNGQRKLRASSPQMDALAEYILSHSRRANDIEWLKERFEKDGLPTDFSSVYKSKQNLIMWLACDGEELRRSLGSLPLLDTNPLKKRHTVVGEGGGELSCLDMALEFEPILSAADNKSCICIFLSSDRIKTAINGNIASLLLRMTKEKDIEIRMLVCVSGDTQAMSALIGTYISGLITGHVQLSVVHGLSQTVTNQMHIIVPKRAAMLVTETSGAGAPPVALIVSSLAFVNSIYESFEQAARFSQPVLSVYGDDYSRNILEIIYQEFCTYGALDVVKDSINPMYMAEENYNEVLKRQGNKGEEYEWRSREFVRFKMGMDEALAKGSVFREILSLRRLNQIASDGFCRMPGLYFMNKGFVDLDSKGCAAILEGYIGYLEKVSTFNLLILDDIDQLNFDNCWQLKQNHHVAINHWSGSEPVMIHSDQLLLLREFQSHFDRLWAQGDRGIGKRSAVMAILRDVLKRLDKRS